MRKRLILIGMTYLKIIVSLFSLLVASKSNAQDRLLAGGFKHVIEVARYSDYGKGYLTITDANGVGIYTNGQPKMNLYTHEYDEESQHFHLYKGYLILEVDGVSAKGWSKEQFYKVVDGRTDFINLKIQPSRDTVINVKIRPLYELPDSVKVFGNQLSTIRGKDGVSRRKAGLTKDTVFEERRDTDFDFFYCDYYDYSLTGDDPLLDKEILNQLQPGWMVRDESKPDLLFTISRKVNENYNYYDNSKSVSLVLEITALDVKRMNDPTITYQPVVWKATVKRQGDNFRGDFDANKEMGALASWMCLPLDDRNVGWEEETLYAPVGITCSINNPYVISEVTNGSRAEQIGLQPGDKLLKASIVNGNSYKQKSVKKAYNEHGWGAVSLYLRDTYEITILRNNQKIKYTLRPVSIRAYRHYLTGGE